MPRLTLVTLAAAVFLPWLLGCHGSQTVRVQPRLSMDDLVPGLGPVDNTHLLLSREPTVGRFTCSLAIARFDSRGETFHPQLELSDIPPAEQAHWVEAFRGVSDIREMVFLSRISSQNGRRDPESLCAVARRFGAPLLLIYTPNRHGPNTAQVLGVLYDVATTRPIATLHAGARFVDDNGRETAPEHIRGDRRDWDARYQAARAFEKHAQACLTELVLLDSPPPTTQPHEWQKPWPERWWVPKVIKTK